MGNFSNRKSCNFYVSNSSYFHNLKVDLFLVDENLNLVRLILAGGVGGGGNNVINATSAEMNGNGSINSSVPRRSAAQEPIKIT